MPPKYSEVKKNSELMYTPKIRGRDLFKKFKPIIRIMIKFCSILPFEIRERLLQTFRNKNGYSGFLIRYILFYSLAGACGDNVVIHQGCYFQHIEKMFIGNNVAFNQMCYIQGSGGLIIGDNVGLAHGTTIETENHRFNDVDVCIGEQGMNYAPVKIEEDVWIGAKATILYGNTIKKGSIVASNAVVTKDVTSYTIVGGVPAKVIKYRKEK